MKVLVIGGTRFMGRETVLALGEAGHDITVFNRGNHQVDWPFDVHEIKGDRNNDRDLGRLADIDPDAVVDFAAYTGTQVGQLLDVLPADAHLVFISSGAVYAPVPELPWTEDGALGPWRLWGDYGRGKLEAEQTLNERQAVGSTIMLRLPYVLGPKNYADREEFILNRLLDDETILVPGDGQAVIQFIAAQQVAAAIREIVHQAGNRGSTDSAPAQAFNLASPNCLTTLSGLVEICGRVANKTPIVRSVPATKDPGAESPLDANSLIFPFPNQSFILDTQRAEMAEILSPPIPLEEMIGESYDALVGSRDPRAWARTDGERSVLEELSGRERTWS